MEMAPLFSFALRSRADWFRLDGAGVLGGSPMISVSGKKTTRRVLVSGMVLGLLAARPATPDEEGEGTRPSPREERPEREESGALERMGEAGARALDEALEAARKAMAEAGPALDEVATRARWDAYNALEAAKKALEDMKMSEVIARALDKGVVEPGLAEALRAADELVHDLDPNRLSRLGIQAMELARNLQERLRELEEELPRRRGGNPMESALLRAGAKLARGLREALEEMEPAPALENAIRNIDLEKSIRTALRLASEALKHGPVEKALAEAIRGLEIEATIKEVLEAVQEEIEPETEWY
jgi:hypothetical protein